MNNLLLSLLLSALGQFGGGYGYRQGLSSGSSSLPVDTLAVVQCLYQEGRIGDDEARALIDQQGRRRRWPVGWERSIDPRRLGQAIGAAGGCRSLMARLDRSGSRIATRPVPVAPWPINGPGITDRSPSQSEGFGLAPYR
ncbi:hypothetical protein [Synechococcus sp. 1G10]|uniref:hypothetical protein n=1 Tax=Synechococcus sp. 1G10 TaxID=2025605 RepID=UPI000B9830AA|nr:hypothetical protein [Synechococcus sp. 1G10]